jgi:hypothetical protein
MDYSMIALPIKAIRTCLVFSAFLLVYSPGVHAYLDPSTGSMIVSALVGIFASIALAVKTYWYKLKNLFRKKEDIDSSENSTSDN